ADEETVSQHHLPAECPAGHHPQPQKFKHMSPQQRILWDIFLLGLMALSSGYMMALLWRHKRQYQHLHSTSRIPQASPEQRATRTILLLMGSFVVMYFVDCVISSSYGKMQKEDPVRFAF
ncbi:Hypothetical predicted protein, partial [Marmota monax]